MRVSDDFRATNSSFPSQGWINMQHARIQNVVLTVRFLRQCCIAALQSAGMRENVAYAASLVATGVAPDQ